MKDVLLKVVHFVCARVCPCCIQVSAFNSWSHITNVSFVTVCCLNGCSCVSHPVHTWADGRFQCRWGNEIAGLDFKSRSVAVCHEAAEFHSLTHSQVIFIESCRICLSLVLVKLKLLWYLNTKFLQPSQHSELFSQEYCSESPKTFNHKHKKKNHLEQSLLAACGSAVVYKQSETLQTYSKYENRIITSEPWTESSWSHESYTFEGVFPDLWRPEGGK